MNLNITHFLKKVSIFIFATFLLFIVLFILLINLNSSQFNNYKLDKSINKIYVGDSHVKLAINDKLIAKSANFSEHSESYQFSYYKIEGLIRNNPNVKKIYLGFSYHNLSDYYEYFVLNENSAEIPAKYFYIIPFSEKMKLIYINKNKLPLFIRNIIKDGINNLYNDKHGYLGEFENGFENSKSKKSSMDKRISFQFYKNEKLNNFSNYNIKYINKIIALCKNKNIELILLNTPLDSHYKSKIPNNYVRKYNEFIKQNELKTIDFNEFRLSDNCFVPDGDHVSQKGAKIVSTLLNK